MKQISLRARVLFFFFLTLFLISNGGVYLVYVLFKHTIEEDAEAFLRAKIHTVHSLLSRHAEDYEALQAEIDWHPNMPYHEVYIQIIRADGSLLAQSKNAFDFSQLQKSEKPKHFLSPQGHPLLFSYTKTLKDDGFFVVLDLSSQEHTLSQLRLTFELHSIVVTIFALLGAVFLSRVTMQPIQTLVAETELLKKPNGKNLDVESYPKELKPLVIALNSLYQKLGEQIQRLSRFAENIAHEMRNPIHILMGECEVALSKARNPQEYRDILHSALEEYGNLSRLIEALLFIARAENTAEPIQKQCVDLQPLISEMLEFYRPLAEESEVRLTETIEPDLSLFGDVLLLKRALGNLIENAIAYAGKKTEVRMVAFKTQKHIVLKIIDNGSGIAKEHLPHLFERFYRVHSQVKGTGLGLAIVQSIMMLHHAVITVDSTVGQGTTFTLTFNSDVSQVQAV